MNDSIMENLDSPFTFRSVQVFVAAVEAQSVTRAAHRLGISPSSVSQQLAALETALGARLLERTARVFRLTRAGQQFLEPAKKLLDDVTSAKATLVMADQAPPMALKVASLEELDATVTAPWLLRLQALHPNISLSLTSGASHENHDALASRAVDVMLGVEGVAVADWVETHPILRDPFIVVTSARATKPLTERPFVRYAPDLHIGRQIEAQLRRTDTLPARGFAFTTNQALFAMAAEIDGWAITTALAFLGTPHAHERLIAQQLPFARFSRRLALHARAGTLGDLPAQIAGQMRTQITERILPEASAQLPKDIEAIQIL